MERGLSPSKAIDKVLEIRDNIEYRQVAAVDSNGKTASFTGKNILGKNSVSTGKSCIAAGNLLLKESLTQEMISNFENNKTIHLAERLILALKAGINHGGEEGPTHSSAILVADKHQWPLVDLRVDWSEKCPVEKLAELWVSYQPQMNDYILRAVDPSQAPSYGVPGDI